MKLVPVYRPSPSGLGRHLQEEGRAPHRHVHAAQEGPLEVPG